MVYVKCTTPYVQYANKVLTPSNYGGRLLKLDPRPRRSSIHPVTLQPCSRAALRGRAQTKVSSRTDNSDLRQIGMQRLTFFAPRRTPNPCLWVLDWNREPLLPVSLLDRRFWYEGTGHYFTAWGDASRSPTHSGTAGGDRGVG
jgi:hypothetical protein